MYIGEKVQVVRGEHEGKRAKIRGAEGFFYHVQLLTRSGRKQANGLVSIHRSAIALIAEEGRIGGPDG